MVESVQGADCGKDADQAAPASRQAAPPHDHSLVITSRGLSADFSTYEDENGDPCSAV